MRLRAIRWWRRGAMLAAVAGGLFGLGLGACALFGEMLNGLASPGFAARVLGKRLRREEPPELPVATARRLGD